MDYADKFVILNVRNQLKKGYKIIEIEWYTYFENKSDVIKVLNIIKKMVPSLNSKLQKSDDKWLLRLSLKIDKYPKYFQRISKMIKNIIESNNGEYDGYEFVLKGPHEKINR